MEVPQGKLHKTIVYIYEAVGTGFLLYAINMSKDSPYAKFGIAFTIFAMILIGGPITGAHYNPAVTIGVFISNKHWKEDWVFALLIMLSQFFGAIWGVCLAWLSLYNTNGKVVSRAQVPVDEIVSLQPGAGVTIYDAF